MNKKISPNRKTVLIILVGFLLAIAFVGTASAKTITVDDDGAAKLGEAQGTLVGFESQKPLAGATIILCLVNNEEECTLQASLIATTEEDGTFKLPSPLGKYIVLYNTSGEAKEGWREIDQLKINYKLQGRRPRTPTSFITDEFYDTFGGGGGGVVHKGTSVSFSDGIIESVEGAFTSEKYGLTMEFHDGKPIEVIATEVSVPTTPTSPPLIIPTPTVTATKIPTPEEKGVPGFEVLFAIAGLLTVAYLLRRRK